MLDTAIWPCVYVYMCVISYRTRSEQERNASKQAVDVNLDVRFDLSVTLVQRNYQAAAVVALGPPGCTGSNDQTPRKITALKKMGCLLPVLRPCFARGSTKREATELVACCHTERQGNPPSKKFKTRGPEAVYLHI